MLGKLFLLIVACYGVFSYGLRSSMQVGDFLNMGEILVSPGNKFELGFMNDTGGKYVLGIRFRFINTVVWTAPSTASVRPQLQLRAEGLFFLDNTGQQQIFVYVYGATCAYLGENGNFMLNTSTILAWQSFKSPSDTLLAGQRAEGRTEGDSIILTSGSYTLYLNQNSIGLHSSAVPESNSQSYWDFQRDQTKFHEQPTLTMNATGILTFTDGKGPWNDSSEQNSYVYVLDFGREDVTRRLTLERDGNLRVYSLSQDNSSWSITWQAEIPDYTQECKVFGKCGAFGICTYRPGPVCTCPPGFHFVDPHDGSKGCEYNVPLTSCNSSENTWVRLNRADYTYNDYSSAGPMIMSLEDCKTRCKNDCRCLGIVYKVIGTGRCYFKGPNPSKGPLQVIYNGFQVFSGDSVVFLKVSNTSLPVENETYDQLYVTNMDSISMVNTSVVRKMEVPMKHKVALVVIVAELMVFIAAAVPYGRYVQKKIKSIQTQMEVEGGAARFTYHQLEIATGFFKDKLGAGGFGTVYKGVLENGTIVAVKNIEMATQAEKQFQVEFATLGKVHHINLVRLVGYCAEGSHRLLVYEYMPNGSLEKALLSKEVDGINVDESLLKWNTRFSIGLGIARGITYLHEECQECIIHCDIKPENILLDEKFCPKVSDFGLAKLAKRQGTLNITTIRGTRGYMAPEWVRNVTITPKVDVYSYGMVLLDLLSGREKNSAQGEHFPTWAFRHCLVGNLKCIADGRMGDTIDWVQFEVMLRVSFWCVQPDANLRPPMNKVVEMIEGNVVVPEPPFPRMAEDDPVRTGI